MFKAWYSTEMAKTENFQQVWKDILFFIYWSVISDIFTG